MARGTPVPFRLQNSATFFSPPQLHHDEGGILGIVEVVALYRSDAAALRVTIASVWKR